MSAFGSRSSGDSHPSYRARRPLRELAAMGDVAHELRTTRKEIEYMKGSYSSTAGPGSPVFPGAAAMAKSEAGEAIKKYIDGLQATDPMEGAVNSWLVKGGGGGGGGSGGGGCVLL